MRPSYMRNGRMNLTKQKNPEISRRSLLLCAEARHPQLFEQGEHVRGGLAVCERPGRVRGPAVATQVGDNQPEVLCEAGGERFPVLTTTAEAVQKNEWLLRVVLSDAEAQRRTMDAVVVFPSISAWSLSWWPFIFYIAGSLGAHSGRVSLRYISPACPCDQVPPQTPNAASDSSNPGPSL